MNKQNFIRRLAGTMTLIGVVLTVYFSNWFLIIPGFVGFNLIQSTYTGVCPAESIFDRYFG